MAARAVLLAALVVAARTGLIMAPGQAGTAQRQAPTRQQAALVLSLLNIQSRARGRLAARANLMLMQASSLVRFGARSHRDLLAQEPLPH